jgi:hypothetical protein
VSPYAIAWLVAGTAGVLGTLTMVFWTRCLAHGWLRRALCVLPVLLLLVPARIPDFPDNYAPAFVVAIFEALFQTNGQPLAATRMLILALAVGLIIVFALGRLGRSSSETSEATNPE